MVEYDWLKKRKILAARNVPYATTISVMYEALPKLLSPMSDLVFKALFGQDIKECRVMLMDLLNAVLFGENSYDHINNIIYMNPFNLQEYKSDKLSVLDIKVSTEKGLIINIEVQVKNDDDYRKRSLYYWSKIYGEKLSEGQQFKTLKKAIVMNIISFDLIKESTNYHTCFRIMEKDEHFALLDDLEIHYLELKKYDSGQDIATMTRLELWLAFLKNAGNKDGEDILNRLAERSEIIRMAIKHLKRISADEEIRYKYLDWGMARIDQISKLEYAKSKGEKIGEKRGEKRGEKTGKKKGVELTLIALEAFREGKSLNEVMRLTGMGRKELLLIKKQLMRN